MVYIVTSDAVGLAIGPMAETANDVQEALNKARQMSETGLANISIEDETGHKIEGDELLDCITGKRRSPKTCRQSRKLVKLLRNVAKEIVNPIAATGPVSLILHPSSDLRLVVAMPKRLNSRHD